ncbi:Saccharopine dehydrogenase-domain-containing protein [Cristinia sonorae]|uniref:Saccharopine dehydrogenase-domain-containing protein n=1 Tax=Cristinia sonorae TaxID=1940300 RepID=A0A8K0XTF1_9AGAR|nr:Saccharopine dehydrogenase-domain-containing protein [Cristinia sonorae]
MAFIRRAPHALRRTFTTATPHIDPSKLTIGIRREDPHRIWERRCPLTPDAVHDLVHKEGVNVLVQDCERRVWTTNDFIKAGAVMHPTLSPSHITLGIKETPLDELLTSPIRAPSESSAQSPLVSRTHLMFSHTVKGQMYNMELLSKFLGPPNTLPPRLVDYELLTGEDGKRSVGFGWFAGVAGALESLCALAHAHLELGIASQFLYTPRPHMHPSLASIRSTLRDVVGARIAADGTPKGLGPIVFGVTGTGKVAQGVLDLLADLPICMVNVQDLAALVTNPGMSIYVVHALPSDYFVRADGQPYERSHYYANPQAYSSVFHSKVAPYLTLLFNGAGWAPNFPRMMTNDQLTFALEKARQIGKGRFACIGDISCDVEGGLEFMPRASTLSSPFYSTRPPTLPSHLPSVTMMSVDILPTALPLEASEHFSSVLMPYLKSLIRSYRTPGQPHLNGDVNLGRAAALERATVASDGKLRDAHKWLEGPLNVWRETRAASGVTDSSEPPAVAGHAAPKKKVLMLGSGMVAGPAVDEICSWKDVELVVASNVLSEANRLTKKHPSAKAVNLDVSDWSKVDSLIGECDLVISLLPVPFHPKVAEACIQHRKHLVTASYISPAMRALHDRAVSSDVILLNEIGLDPGIDHCSAISLLSDLRAQNKQVVSFTSFCGGIPAPEDAEGVPLKYKFSWSPKGVLSAALNGAKFKLWDKVEEIQGKDLLRQNFQDLPISEVLKLEGLANRDSLPYGDTYELGSDIRTLFRGTLRYQGFSALMHQFKSLGFLESTALIQPTSWSDFATQAMAARLQRKSIPQDPASFRSALADCLEDSGAEDTTELIEAMDWFGISPSSKSTAPLPTTGPTPPIDVFASLLAHKLRYLPNERDLVVLSHEIVAHSPTREHEEEIHTSSLIAYGTPSASAMSRTVGLPVAFATRAVLDGGVQARGVQGPGVERSVWGRVLSELERAGLGMRESVKKVKGVRGGSVERSLVEARSGMRD